MCVFFFYLVSTNLLPFLFSRDLIKLVKKKTLFYYPMRTFYLYGTLVVTKCVISIETNNYYSNPHRHNQELNCLKNLLLC